MSENNWLTKLKAGDVVIVDPASPGRDYIASVARVTATQIVVSVDGREARFNRKTGLKKANAWDWAVLREPLPDRIAAVRESTRKAVLIHRLKAQDWGSVPTRTLELIHALLVNAEVTEVAE